MTLEILYNSIFGKWCFVSVFELSTVSNVDATDPTRNKKIQFSQNFGMVNFEKSAIRIFYSTILHVLNRVIHAYGLCFNAIS